MVGRDDLVRSLNQLLAVEQFQDYCPNGLQIEGRAEIRKVVTGVTASLALIEQVLDEEADALLVHHGFFWKGEPAPLTGMKGRRVRALIQKNINLIAYHLPLDAHPSLGNNAQLGALLGFKISGDMQDAGWSPGLVGELPTAMSGDDFCQRLTQQLGREPLYFAGHTRPLQRFAWCTGAAEGALVHAAELGVDAYISGEVSERTLHEARELGISYFSAGHHATERGGVQALARWITQQWPAVDAQFIDDPNPV